MHEFMKVQPFAQSPSKAGGTLGYRQLHTAAREGFSSSSNVGINPAFDKEAVG
jgi:hypothetical protein